jgi:hypothetical protein
MSSDHVRIIQFVGVASGAEWVKYESAINWSP